jgi:DNA-binding NarL/FixJ family response regulator
METLLAPGPIPKTKILVVDDHPLFRAGLVRLLEDETDLVVCGEAESAPTAIAAVTEFAPDLVLLDLRLHNADGLELIKSLKAMDPNLSILVISQFEESLFAERALRAGASGYVMKQEASEEVLVAIRTVLAGDDYVSRKIAMRLFRKSIEEEPAEVPPGDAKKLTDRELQIFQLLGCGMSIKQIAGELHLSGKTVETHRENIKNKLGYESAAELAEGAARWVAEHLLPPTPTPTSATWIRPLNTTPLSSRCPEALP